MGLCFLLAVGLIAAAFVAPPVAQFQAPEPSACVIETDGDPIPGTQLSILVTSPSGPVADVPVYLSDESVGATNESGVVEATVPYDFMFEVTADISEQSACDVTRDGDADENGVWSADGDVEADPNSTVEIVSVNETETGTGTSPSAETHLTSGLTIPLQSIDGVGTEGDTATETETEIAPTIGTRVLTEGNLTIDAPETADPGEEVDIRAEISTNPVPDASIRVDGTHAGETDANGTATVALPEDSQNATVTVSRGDFEAQTTVDIQLLELSFADAGLVLPGQPATVEAVEGSEPAPDAPVAVDGERVATTDADGHATVDLPWDPTASVTVQTATQSASVSVLTHHAGNLGAAAVIFVLLTIATAAAAWLDGRRGVVLLYAGSTAIGAVALAARLQTPLVTAAVAFVLLAATTGVAGRLGGWRGVAALYGCLLVAVGTILASRFGPPAAIGVGIGGLLMLAICWLWLSGHGSSADGDSDNDGDDQPLTDRLYERLTTAVLKTVSQLETVLALTPRLGHWLRTQPRSVRRLAGRFGGWLAGIPSAARAGFSRLGRRRLAVIVAFVLAVSVGIVLAGPVGALIAVGVFLALGVVVLAVRWFRARSTSATDSAASGGHPSTATDGESSGGEGHPPESIPDLWRAFARGVTPTWETRAPAEIEARAIDQGYPHGPVDGLTTVFCEIEYGDRSPTDAMVARAKAAYAKLETPLELESGSEPEPAPRNDAGGER